MSSLNQARKFYSGMKIKSFSFRSVQWLTVREMSANQIVKLENEKYGWKLRNKNKGIRQEQKIWEKKSK